MQQSARRAWCFGWALLVASGVGCGGVESVSPNVLLVTLDTTRVDRFSSYGHPLPLTPTFDALAADGVRFEHAQVSAALTPVSHATILTGLEPYGHGLRVLVAGSGDRLPPDVPTMATILSDAGYATAAYLSAFPVSERYGLERGFDVFDSGLVERIEGVDPRRQKKNQRRSDLTTERVLAWLETVPEPFFLWIHYWDPHDPITTPPEADVNAYMQLATSNGEAPDPYDAEVRYVDAQFARVVAALKANGQYERTFVGVTADHGEGLGEHDWHAHRLLYEEQIHVPLIMRWPDGPRASTVSGLVRTTDIAATILDVLDLAPPGPLHGRSLVEAARSGVADARTTYAESLAKWDEKDRMVSQRPDDDLLHMVCDGRFKLIYKPLHPETSELYDLEQDPDEARNLFASHTEVAAVLIADLERRAAFVLEPLGAALPDEGTSSALSDLGYLESNEDE